MEWIWAIFRSLCGATVQAGSSDKGLIYLILKPVLRGVGKPVYGLEILLWAFCRKHARHLTLNDVKWLHPLFPKVTPWLELPIKVRAIHYLLGALGF